MMSTQRALLPFAKVATTAIALAAALANSACAQTAAPEAAAPAAEALPITGNFTLTNNYVSRGFTQSWSKPAIQGGIDYAHASGFFVGTWLSSVSGTEFRGGSSEWDIYAGYNGTLGPIGYTAALYQYLYQGSNSPFVEGRKYDYTEVKLGVSKDIFSFNAFITVSDDYFGTFDKGRGSLYLDFNANPDLGNGYTLLTHIGVGALAKHSYANWTDYKVGVSKALPGNWTLTGAVTYAQDQDKFWTGSDFAADSTGNTYTKRLGKTALVVSIGKTF
jgi:uncharacterized protein (TIGR02001 family)